MFSLDAFSEETYRERKLKSHKPANYHKVVKNIALLVDWWEHAWALDYQADKAKYLINTWKIINWDVVNDRINAK